MINYCPYSYLLFNSRKTINTLFHNLPPLQARFVDDKVGFSSAKKYLKFYWNRASVTLTMPLTLIVIKAGLQELKIKNIKGFGGLRCLLHK